jgi:hypothetical protein
VSDEDRLEPSEARVRGLLGELRAEHDPAGEERASAVTQTVRWQKPLRAALLGAVSVGGSVLDGIDAFWRGRKPR